MKQVGVSSVLCGPLTYVWGGAKESSCMLWEGEWHWLSYSLKEEHKEMGDTQLVCQTYRQA